MKKYTDVFSNEENVVMTTKGNDIINIIKDNNKDNNDIYIKSSKGSDILFLKGVQSLDGITAVKETDSKNLLLNLADGRKITIENYFTTTEGKATKSSVKTLKLDTGLEIDLNTLVKYDNAQTFTPNKKGKVTGTVFCDTMDFSQETSKKLNINAGAGDDTVTGGQLSDTFTGGKGTNTFVYNSGSGQDTIKLTKGEKLIIKYVGANYEDEAFSLSDFKIEEVKKDVVISRTYKNSLGLDVTDKITIKNMTKNNLAENVEFWTGTTSDNAVKIADIKNNIYDIVATKKSITGTNLNERIFGTLANDTIKGLEGNDILYGNLGNDKLYGGKGADKFVFETYAKENPLTNENEFFGAGNDTIYDANFEDTLVFSKSNIEDISFEMAKNKKDLIIYYYDKDDTKHLTKENSLVVKNYFKLENIKRVYKVSALDAEGNLSEFDINNLTEESRAELRKARAEYEIQKLNNESAEIDSLTEQLNAAKSEYNTIYVTLQSAQTRNAELQTALTEANNKNNETQDALNTALQNYNNKSAEVEILEGQLSQYELDLQAAQNAYIQAQADLETARQAKDDAETALNEFINENKEVVEQLQALQNAADAARQAYEDALTNSEKTEEELNVLKAAKEQAEADLQSVIDKNTEIATRFDELQAKKTRGENEFENAQEASEETQALITSLTEEKNTLSTELETARNDIENLTNALNNAQEANQQTLAELEQAISDKAAAEEELAQLRENYEQQQEALQELKDKVDGGVSSIIDKIDNLTEKIDILLEENQTIKDESAQKDATITELTGRITGLEAEIAIANNDITTKANEILNLNDKISELESDLEDTNGIITENETQIAELNERINNLNAELETANATIAEKQTKIDNLNTLLENYRDVSLEEQLAQAQADLEEANTAIGEKEAAITALTQEKSSLEEQLTQANTTIGEKEAAITALTQEKSSLEEQLTQANTAIGEKEAAIAELTEQLSQQAQYDIHTFTLETNGETSVLSGENAKFNDVLKFEKSDFENCKFSKNGNDLVIDYFNDADEENTDMGTVTIKDYYSATKLNRPDSFIDKDGLTHSLEDLKLYHNIQTGTSSTDTFVNTKYIDVFQPKGGVDILDNYSADDIIQFTEHTADELIFATAWTPSGYSSSQLAILYFDKNDINHENPNVVYLPNYYKQNKYGGIWENTDKSINIKDCYGNVVNIPNPNNTSLNASLYIGTEGDDLSKKDNNSDNYAASKLINGGSGQFSNKENRLHYYLAREGTDTITVGSSAYSQVYGGEGDDLFTGGGGYLSKLYGNAGNDTFKISTSCSGDIYGGAGNDTYDYTEGNWDGNINDWENIVGGNIHFRTGEGTDTILQSNKNSFQGVSLIFDDALFTDLVLTQDENDLIINYSSDSNDKVIIKDYFLNAVDDSHFIRTLTDKTGLSFDINALYNKEVKLHNVAPHAFNLQNGTFLNELYDTYKLSYGNIDMGDGDDRIIFRADNSASRGSYADTQYGTFSGGAGNDIFDIHSQNPTGNAYYTFNGDSGNDTFNLYNSVYINNGMAVNGGEGQDVFNINWGYYYDTNNFSNMPTKHQLNGGKDDDTFDFKNLNKKEVLYSDLVFSSGDGNDVVNQDGNNTSQYGLLKFNDVEISDMNFVKDENDLIIQYTDNDSVRVTDFFNHIDDIKYIRTLADSTGVEYNINSLYEGNPKTQYERYRLSGNVTGTDNNDTFNIDNTKNKPTINAGGGDDIINVKGEIRSGNNYIYCGSGNDTVNFTNAVAAFDSCNVNIYGDQGDDEFNITGVGRQNLIFNFKSGDGNDVINQTNRESTYSYNKQNGVLNFTDTSSEDMKFVKNNDDLIIKYTNNDSVKITDFFNHIDDANYYTKLTDSNGTEFNINTLYEEYEEKTNTHEIEQSNDTINLTFKEGAVFKGFDFNRNEDDMVLTYYFKKSNSDTEDSYNTKIEGYYADGNTVEKVTVKNSDGSLNSNWYLSDFANGYKTNDTIASETVYNRQGNTYFLTNYSHDYISTSYGDDAIYCNGKGAEIHFNHSNYANAQSAGSTLEVKGDTLWFDGLGNDIIYNATNNDYLAFSLDATKNIDFTYEQKNYDLVITYNSNHTTVIGSAEYYHMYTSLNEGTNTITLKDWYMTDSSKRINLIKYAGNDYFSPTTYYISAHAPAFDESKVNFDELQASVASFSSTNNSTTDIDYNDSNNASINDWLDSGFVTEVSG